MDHLHGLLLLLLVPFLTVEPASAQACGISQDYLYSPNPDTYAKFGAAVAVWQDRILVGAEQEFSSSGGAYLFEPGSDGWELAAQFHASDAQGNDYYGSGVAVEGDTLVIGAQQGNHLGTRPGAVYAYTFDGLTWGQELKLLANDGDQSDYFGCAVALCGDTLVIGARQDEDAIYMAGSAYVFARDGAGWTQEAKLYADSPGFESYFGTSVALSGDTIVVGAPGEDAQGNESGAAYVYVRDAGGWSLQDRLGSPGLGAFDWFGASVAVNGDTAVVGATSGNNQGQEGVYVFVREGEQWTQQASLLSDDHQPGDNFGSALSLEGDTFVVGANRGGMFNGGSSYAFRRIGTTWIQLAEMHDFGGEAELYGNAIALHGERVVAGASHNDFKGTSAGRAHVHELPPAAGIVECTCALGPCGNSDAGGGCRNASGTSAVLMGFGTTDPDKLHFLVAGLNPEAFCVLFQSSSSAPAPPFGNGLLCIGGDLLGIALPPRQADLGGLSAFGPCFGDLPLSRITGAIPGSGTVEYYQLWYRDRYGPCGSSVNTTNACRVQW